MDCLLIFGGGFGVLSKTLDDLGRIFRERFGKIRLETISEHGPTVFYIHFLDVYDSSISIGFDNPGRPFICSHRYLNSERFKPVSGWSGEARSGDIADILVVFERCYAKMRKEIEDFEDLNRKAMEEFNG